MAKPKLSDPEERAHFRDSLRSAREECARNAEAFHAIIHAVERLGVRLTGRVGNLGAYRNHLVNFTRTVQPSSTTPVDLLVQVIVEARNDAMHQGAVARHMASRLIDLALMLEDALAQGLDVRFLMVKNPAVAKDWQTIAAIRQVMLENAFSHLPLFDKGEGKWKLLSDHAVAAYVSRGPQRDCRLAKTVAEAIADKLETPVAESCKRK